MNVRTEDTQLVHEGGSGWMGLHSRGIHVIAIDDTISWTAIVILWQQARLVDRYFSLDYEGFGYFQS